MKGIIFNVQHFCTDDGPGIRSTVFLKGCPLRCAWCHNPESQELQSELFYDPESCIACGNCVNACKQGAHTLENGAHVFHRERCIRCGDCAAVCYAKALEKCGYETDAETLIAEIKRNEAFFRHSDGGLTVSGGEPLFQPDFTRELCRLAKESGIHVCVETSGMGKTDELCAIAEFVDLFLFDYKISDANGARHLGVSSDALILENLAALDKRHAEIILRCPIIPSVNFTKEHFEAIAALAKSMKNIREIQFLPYHPLGVSKAKRLQKQMAFDNPDFLDKTLLLPYASKIQNETKIKTLVN